MAPDLHGGPLEDHRERVRFAIETARLVASERAWVRRRVETVRFLDGIRIVRQMSVDFVAPDLQLRAPAVTSGTGFVETILRRLSAPVPSRQIAIQTPLPLAMPRKRALRHVDARNEDGTALPILTRDENASVSAELLRAQAHEIVRAAGGHLLPDVALAMSDIAGERRVSADRPSARERLVRATSALRTFVDADPRSRDAAEKQRATIWDDDDMRTFLRLLQERYLLFVCVPATPGSRQIVKLSWEERIHRKIDRPEYQRRGQGVYEVFRQPPTGIRIFTRALYAASSFHIEVEVPDALMIRRAELRRRVTFVERATRTSKEQPEICLGYEENVNRAHLYDNGYKPGEGYKAPTGWDVTELASIEVDLVLRFGQVAPVFGACIAMASVLAGGCVLGLTGHYTDHDAGAILVAAPALVAALVSPGGHQLVNRLYRWLRISIVVVMAADFIAAGALAVDLGHTWTEGVWGLACAVAIGATVPVANALRTARSTSVRELI